MKTYPVLMLSLLLAACGGQSESTPPQQPTAPDITLNFVSDQQYSQEENDALQKATYILANQCRPLFSHGEQMHNKQVRITPATSHEQADYGWNNVVEIQFDLPTDRELGAASGNHCYFRLGGGETSGVRGKSACINSCGFEQVGSAVDGGLFTELPGIPIIRNNVREIVFKVQGLDSDYLAANLPVHKPTTDHSDNDYKRRNWQIQGMSRSNILQAIGNNQKNVRVFSGRCMEYNQEGNSIGWTPKSACYKLFNQLVAKITDTKGVADTLMQQAGLYPYVPNAPDAIVQNKDLSIEVDNQGYFFIRNKTIRE